MKFTKAYQEFYDATFDDAPVNHALRDSLARKTIQKTMFSQFTLQRMALRGAFAALVLTASASLVAPHAFAQVVTSASRAVESNITRAFDAAHGLFTDDDITKLSEDETVKSLDYTRDANGEVLDMEKECPPGTVCGFSTAGSTFTTDETNSYRVHAETDSTTGESTLEIVGTEE